MQLKIEHITKVRNLIGDNNILEALKKLKKYLKGSHSRINEIILLSKRYNEIDEQSRKYIVDDDYANRTKNRISNDCLTLLSIIEEELIETDGVNIIIPQDGRSFKTREGLFNKVCHAPNSTTCPSTIARIA